MAADQFLLGGELAVSRLGFGAMRITGPGIWGQPEDPGESRATLRRALELGATLIDTAESYGPYVSEELIADTLFPYPAGLVIATKGGLDRPGPDRWQPNGRPERLRAALEGSLRRLRLDRIDLYQLHRIDPAVPADEQFGVLQAMRDQGLVRHVGLSEVTVPEIEQARAYFPVASVQNQYNLADRHWEDVLTHCTNAGIAFIPWHPLAAGALSRGGASQTLRRLLGRAASPPAVVEVASRLGATPAQIALAWLLQRSPVVLPIPGTAKRAHLEENMSARQLELSPADVALLDAAQSSG